MKKFIKEWLVLCLYVGWVLFIWGNSMQTANQSGSTSGQITEFVNRILTDGKTVIITEHFIRKAAHFTEYSVLGMLAVLLLYRKEKLDRRHSAVMLACSCLTAVLDETIQYFTPGRVCSGKDMLLDISGAVFGFVLLTGLLLADRELRKRIYKVLLIACACGGMILIARIAQVEAAEKMTAQIAAGEPEAETEMTAISETTEQETVSSNEVLTQESAGEQPIEEESEYASLAIANVSKYVNVRSIPDTDGEIVGKVYHGAVAQILETAGEDKDWFRVISGEVEGYIKAEYFLYGDAAAEVIDDYITRTVTVNANRLNIRKEPSVDSKRIGYLVTDEKVTLLEDLGEWKKIAYHEAEGYVSAEYVTVSETFTYAISIEEEKAEKARQQELKAREEASEEETPENIENLIQNITPDGVTDNGQAAVLQEGAAASSDLRKQVVDKAMQYLGYPYVHGGRSLESGTDCSGFTCFVYAEFGYAISRTPSGQLNSAGRSISYSEAQPGDIICYTANGKSCTHVGLYIGDGQIIHAATVDKGVIIGAADYTTIMGVKNVID